ncbi:MAG: hypothetical protein ACN6NW_09510 [Acinetobacter amyesii]|uniref:hypothetical protein n=1 Tax=Acinetobacter amyesii TaxID=2942470 RepID=UPI003D03F58A
MNGLNGINGLDGASPYQVAVSNGYEGNEDQWLESLRGAVGAQGLTGENGFSAYELAIKMDF